jgi:ABC-type transport system substrate-binding protein
MLRIFSTHRLFTFLLTGLMITSCGGGTSSNTPSTTSQTTSQTPTPISPTPTTPQTLTVRVPSLGTSYTVTKSTTFAEINRAATEGAGECVNRYGISQINTTCQAEVRAAQSQAVAFINR